MPSTYSTNLRLELIASGEQANTWGNTTNTNLGTLIESAISGYVSLTAMGNADYTLLALNGANDQARQMYINVPPSANLTATRSIVAPSVPKMYVISNNSSGGQAVRIKTSGSTTTCLIPNGQTKTVVCDGTNFSESVTAADSLLLAANPTLALQATTKQYVDAADALKLNLTGGTLTGALSLVAGTPTGQNATSFNYVDTNYIYKSAGGATQTMNPFLRLNYTPVNPADAVHKAYVDAQIATVTGGYLPLTGGTLTGALTLAGAPTSNLQPATKLYVDNIAASAAATFLPFTGGTLTGALTLAGPPATNLQAATKLYVDTNTANKQPLDGDLTAIADLTGGSGFLKKTGFETWALDTNTYITGNQTITLSGDIIGSGTTAITTTLANSPVIAGTYTNATVTVNAKGIVTSASNGSAFALPIATDTTLGGVKVNGNTVSISSGTLFLNSTNVGNALGYTACRADGGNATGVWNIDTSGSADYLQYAGSYYTANQFYLASNPSGYVTGTGGGASGTWNINILGSAAQLGGYSASQFVLNSALTTILAGYPTVTGVGATGSSWGISITGSSASCTGNAATATSVAWSGVTSTPANYPGGCTGNAATATSANTATTATTANNALALGGTPASGYLTTAVAAANYIAKTQSGNSQLITTNTATSGSPKYLGLYDSAVGDSAMIGHYYYPLLGYSLPCVGNITGSVTQSPLVFVQMTSNGATANPFMTALTNGTLLVNSLASTNGPVYVNNGILTTTNPSDERLKTNIADISFGLHEILQLRPVSYNWGNASADPTETSYGFIAQEVQEVIPELVSVYDYREPFAEEGVERFGLNKEGIYAGLVAAIQELNTKIEDLTAEVNALKGA